LQKLRKSKGLTQKQMGEILGMNERNYRRYEAGQMDPHASVLVKLAGFLYFRGLYFGYN
jgi:transcriptional regulator with XRE-family HTH domain